jgi:hypothetical protein
VVAVSSLTAYFLSAFLIMASGASALVGAVFLRRHYLSLSESNSRSAIYLFTGTALIFSGAALIAWSNVAFEYLISQLQNTIYVDMAATVSACGCVLAR